MTAEGHRHLDCAQFQQLEVIQQPSSSLWPSSYHPNPGLIAAGIRLVHSERFDIRNRTEVASETAGCSGFGVSEYSVARCSNIHNNRYNPEVCGSPERVRHMQALATLGRRIPLQGQSSGLDW
ncbi:hypothetical protein WG66_004823 [Moniliophthora roreri]|nr:hypothetical protein WG66_004823 [Moniliophthora roreri]